VEVGLVALHTRVRSTGRDDLPGSPGGSLGGDTGLPWGRLLSERRSPGRRDDGSAGVRAGPDGSGSSASRSSMNPTLCISLPRPGARKD